MKIRRSALSLALSTGLLCAAAWSPMAQACSSDPFLGSICIMAWTKMETFGRGMYTAAAGQSLSITRNTALYAVIGNTYGGIAGTSFQLPNLRGRVIVGVGQGSGLPNFDYGEQGGAAALNLSLSQLPSHVHDLGTQAKASVGPGNLAANTTIGTLAANTTIGTLAANTTLSGLSATLQASTGTAAEAIPAGAALPSYVPPAKFYSNTAPSVAMNTASIVISGTPSTSLTGAPATTLTGTPSTSLSGAPKVTIYGETDRAGSNAAVPIMQPYVAMVYYIATAGQFPIPD